MSTPISEIIPFLERSLSANIIEWATAPLTAKGENYGSTMLSVEVKAKFDDAEHLLNDDIRIIRLAVKLPVTDHFLVCLFQPRMSCVKENAFYTEIIPAFYQLQRQCGVLNDDFIDMFIHCYGARLSANPSMALGPQKPTIAFITIVNISMTAKNAIADAKIADENALLVLENIKYKGFNCVGHIKGFHKFETEVILKNLGKFHALPIALRSLYPKIFEERVKPYLQNINSFENICPGNTLTEHICTSLRQIPDLNAELLTKVFEELKICAYKRISRASMPDTPYTTITHYDLWKNNIMFSCDDRGRMDKVKFFDFQLTTYDSFVSDLIFFLYTSVNETVRKQNMEHFFQHYYKHFYHTLEILGCPLDPYTYEKFRMEIKNNAKNELEHIAYRLKVILSESSPSAGDLTLLLQDDHVLPLFCQTMKDLLLDFERLQFL